MKRKLSFYITIKGITMRLKNASLRTISHIAEQLADLENADELNILVTLSAKHCDWILDDADLFVEYVKKVAENSSRLENDALPIDLVITAIRNDFPDAYIIHESNAIITVLSQSKPRKKFKVFAVLSDEIELHVEQADSQTSMIRFDTIDKLIQHLHAIENFGL